MPETQKQTWRQWLALTTTILAVCAAIASLKGASYSTRVQILTTQEANQWAYFQAKSIKKHSFQLNRDILSSVRLMEAKSPQAQKFLGAKLKEYDDEIARYAKEEAQIKADAEANIKQEESLKRKASDFGLAVLLLLIAITASAVGALIKKKLLWYVGLALGIWGLVYMVKGYLF